MKNPLLDLDFLKELDNQTQHEVYAKVIALTFDEKPTEEITGRVTSGSVNIDGTSAIRRTCSVSLVAKDVNIHDFYWSLNTKFILKVGLRNFINSEYPEIIWFKQGMFLITSFSTALSASGYNINISGKDKMCMLNGDIGGVINSISADFGTYDEVDADGNITRYKYPLKEIILEAVHQYAGEPYHNIIIEDLDDQGFELMEYRGDVDLYMLIDQNADEVTNIRFNDDTLKPYNVYDTEPHYILESEDSTYSNSELYFSKDADGNYHQEGISFETYEPGKYYIYDKDYNRYTENTINLNSKSFIYDQRITSLDYDQDTTPTHIWVDVNGTKNIYTVARIQYGDTCGYRLTELTYAGDLVGAVGSAITAILDKIVQMLGNYEYFYDVDGAFHFRRKRTYVNNSWNNIVNNRDEIYVDSAAYTSDVVYSFTDGKLISSFNNTPNLANLRNDYSIWGKRNSSSGQQIPIHLRFAIDEKPRYYKNYSGRVYLTQEEYDRIISGADDDTTDSLQPGQVIQGGSRFHVTPLPPGISEDWWEIDDWARRYLFFADVDEEHDIDYYLGLNSQELCDIINATTKPTKEEEENHNFNYYVYMLKKLTLGNFGKKWQTEDWLTCLPLPVGISSYYYSNIVANANKGKVTWCYLFDTALKDGQEYIYSIEHGMNFTDSKEKYPTSSPGCSHVFSYALDRKSKGQEYHSYIFDPQVPDSFKNESNFVDKEGSDEITVIKSNFEISDWREIIYQMQKDYYKYQHDNNFLATVAANNPKYYPTGVTGYEQYYIDINGFWRQLYDPTIKPIDLKTFQPEESNKYYVWDENTQKFTKYTFREATNILPVDNDKEYFFYKGIKSLDTLIAIEQAKQDEIDQAQSQMSKEIKSLRVEDFSSQEIYNQAVSNITDKYSKIISSNTISLRELKNGYRRSQFLQIKTIEVQKDGTEKVNYDLALADNLVKAFYPYFEKIDDISWKDYEPYEKYSDSKKYFKHAFVKDLTQLSEKISYFTKSYDSTGKEVYTKVTDTAIVDNLTAEPDELGRYPTKEVPKFKINNKYYSFEGYEKVSTLEQGNVYYEYGSYKRPTSYKGGVDYYDRTLVTNDDQTTYIFTKRAKNSVNQSNYAKYFIKIQNPNPADKTIVRGYIQILDIPADKTYYALTYDTAGNVIASTPSYFTRGKSYYTKKENGEYEFAFTFEKGTVYYVYNGYKEVLDLTIDDDDSSKLSSGNFYYIYGEEAQKIINTSDNDAYFILGKIYYGYIQDKNIKNEKYFIKVGKNFEEKNVLKEFLRGSTYYVNEEGYDLVDSSSGFDLENQNYYVYTHNFNKDDTEGSSRYYTLSAIVNNMADEDEYGKLTVACMNDIKTNYGIFVDEDKNIYRLGQSYDFYIKQTRYRPVNYYTFAFYKIAEKYYENMGTNYYYILQNKEYVPVNVPNRETFDLNTYYILLDGYDLAEQYDEEQQYYQRVNGDYIRIKEVSQQDFNKGHYFIKNPISVYLTDEFNIKTHWTTKLEVPESLLFWFDFLDISDGEMAKYSVKSVGNRPKSVNDDKIKAIYYRDTPTVIFCGVDGVFIKTFINRESFNRSKGYYYEKNYQTGEYVVAETYSAGKDYYRKMTPEDKQPGYVYINLTDTIDNLFSISAQGKTAFNELDNFLYNYSYCTESITMNTIPIYYLEPNVRVFVRDDKSGINGEYIIQKLTIPLQYNGMMSITATKAVDRIL